MDEKSTRTQSVPTILKKKASAMNEIQAWVNGNNKYLSNPEVTRNSGQLADNVTEERMLKSKLMELSKERYKFLVKVAYEKKVFSDRQVKKPALRHIFLESSRVSSKTPKRALTSIPSNSRSVFTANTETSKLIPRSYTRVSWYKIDRDKQTPPPSSVNIESSQKRVQENTTDNKVRDIDIVPLQLAKQNQFENVQDAPVIRHPILFSKSLGIAQSKTSVDVSSQSTQRMTSGITSSSVSSSGSSWKKLSLPENSGIKETTQTHSSTNTKIETTPTWLRKEIKESIKYGARVESLVTDPRYACLEQVLSPVLNKANVDVETIVDQIESLHVRPKKKVNSSKKTKIEIKALEYMKSKGFVF